MTRRGDVVLIKFPFTDVAGAKVRPASLSRTIATTKASQDNGGDDHRELAPAQ